MRHQLKVTFGHLWCLWSKWKWWKSSQWNISWSSMSERTTHCLCFCYACVCVCDIRTHTRTFVFVVSEKNPIVVSICVAFISHPLAINVCLKKINFCIDSVLLWSSLNRQVTKYRLPGRNWVCLYSCPFDRSCIKDEWKQISLFFVFPHIPALMYL